MKITRCSTAVVEANYDYTYVRIFNDRGEYGTGECFFAPGLTAALREMFPLLIGRDPREVDRLARHLWRKGSGAGAVAGYLYNAVSGIETALWDLVGKSYGVPCYQLLGGKLRDSIRIYADCHAGDNIESWGPMLTQREPEWLRRLVADQPQHEERYESELYRERAQQMVSAGFDARKFDIDSIVLLTGEELHRPLTDAEIAKMVECVAAAREGAGPDVDLAVDCHWRFQPSDAKRIARDLAPSNLLWLEDPCPPENIHDFADVKALGACPILTGENLNRRHGFWDLITARAVDLVAPDIQKCGGMLEGKRIGELAEMQGIRFAPHNIASPLGTIASAHVCATLPNFVALEFHGSDVPFWPDLISRPGRSGPLIDQGRIHLTEAPGLGCELNELVARQYAKPGETWFA
ncbi:MAG: mandelate racemase/muconate lactonizing enzyme family protein [Planctomycetales bacterium]|nr:mandelate racemase/muconate lactonizing enzyme family protein [Planctomycetales bacterium]